MADPIKATGRPSDYTEETAASICLQIMEGASLREVCRADDMPDRVTVYRWLAAHEAFRNQYAKAAEVRADEVFDEMFEIADDGSNDWVLRTGKDGAESWQENGEALNRSKLRIDTRKWALARMNPRKYGEKLALGGADGLGPLVTRIVIEAATDDDADGEDQATA